MASLPQHPPVPITPNPASRNIPLECLVCPNTPRFSDASHLLTHIASKGHLHYETQTKLKAHANIEVQRKLRLYEEWYRDNGIEALLVDRLKAKEVKEAARNKRNRASSVAQPKQVKKKPKRSTSNNIIKDENEELPPDLFGFNGMFASDNETEALEELFPVGDMLSLKGQIWPGMGKMDLANEEMKRTRNQRKPTSVVEKMRRTSEGIEPTQVVMTPEFDVERIKGVYDDDSPVSDQDDPSPPRKVTRQRRKKSQPLTEISANVPRGENSRVGRQNTAYNGKSSKLKPTYEQEVDSDMHASLGMFRHPHDVFRDEDGKNGMYHNTAYSTPHQREQRFDLRDRYEGHASHTMSHSSVVSPTPSTRDVSSRQLTGGSAPRTRFQGQPYMGNGGQFQFGSFGHSEASYGMDNGSICYNGSRMPFSNPAQYDSLGQDQYRLPSSNQVTSKQGDYSHANSDESLANPGANLFLTVHGGNPNPLFSQDRFLNSPYGQPASHQPLSRSHSSAGDQEQRLTSTSNIKIEPRLCEGLDNNSNLGKEPTTFDPKDIWQAQDPELALHDGLHSNELDL